jgi:hypothetical protein
MRVDEHHRAILVRVRRWLEMAVPPPGCSATIVQDPAEIGWNLYFRRGVPVDERGKS